MSPARSQIPEHLKRYAVEQDYSRYTPEDQAVWRFLMRQLNDFLAVHAHPCYVEGLKKTGIDIERIPEISVMDLKLAKFGWGAIPVSGFIPPAAFMEFQSLGILPIAADMRSIEHLTYTPAPDIVHEAAGHAPILIQPEFAAYLKKYAEVARNAIITKKDMDQYSAIRELSDVKENRDSSAKDIARAEAHLEAVNRNLTYVSEAGWLSRMNWWTAEYGLIGNLKNPKIFGAGLLSSLGEAHECLSSKVRKIPLSIECIDVGYDITEPQPQLFVTPSFEHLGDVLEQLAAKMAYRIGGKIGLERARDAATVNTVELNTGLQISGVLDSFASRDDHIDFVKFSGPVSLAYDRKQLDGHGPTYHVHGFSSPLGSVDGLSDLKSGQTVRARFTSGIELHGDFQNDLRKDGKVLLLTFQNCTVKRGDEILFCPSWGAFDLALGTRVFKVFGGAADRAGFGDTDDFVAQRVPGRIYTAEQKEIFSFFSEVRSLRESSNTAVNFPMLVQKYFELYPYNWIFGVELLEIGLQQSEKSSVALIEKLSTHLLSTKGLSQTAEDCVKDGIRLAGRKL